VPVDPRAIVDQVLVGLGAEVEAREAEVVVGELPGVVADQVQLAQVLQNLMANAIKFTPPERRPEVEVSGRREEDMVVLSVADRGIGVEPGESGEVFGMFRRGSATGRYDGSGIGLAVAAKVVSAHGGRLWVEPRPGGGSIFSFTLAASREAPAA
jgi:signal transduction histidine kinase